MWNADASISICSINISMPVVLRVFNGMSIKGSAISPCCLLSSCPSFQRSTTRCSTMGSSKSLALRKSLRSWCWPRRCWKRLEAVNHSSLNGSWWMKRQTKPMNVGPLSPWSPAHVFFLCGSRRGHRDTGQHLVKTASSQYSQLLGTYTCPRSHSAQIDYLTMNF